MNKTAIKIIQNQLRIEQDINAEAIKKIIELKKAICVLTAELNQMQYGMKTMLKYYTKQS